MERNSKMFLFHFYYLSGDEKYFKLNKKNIKMLNTLVNHISYAFKKTEL